MMCLFPSHKIPVPTRQISRILCYTVLQAGICVYVLMWHYLPVDCTIINTYHHENLWSCSVTTVLSLSTHQNFPYSCSVAHTHLFYVYVPCSVAPSCLLYSHYMMTTCVDHIYTENKIKILLHSLYYKKFKWKNP
jgi:hypothetical protein